jgi:hypothetical protein
VFSCMLFGLFAKAANGTIDIGYDGAVLQAIVDYMYTDTVPNSLLLDSNEDEETSTTTRTEWDISSVRFLVSLVDATNYFALPEVSVNTQMKKSHGVILLVVLGPCKPDWESTIVLQDMALAKVKQNHDVLIQGNKALLALISPSHIEEIIKDSDNLFMDDHSCFQMIQLWSADCHSRKHTPVFLGVQFHTLRACVYFCLKMGQNV